MKNIFTIISVLIFSHFAMAESYPVIASISSVSKEESKQLEKFVGFYSGSLISEGHNQVVTQFKMVGNDLVGKYDMSHTGQNTKTEDGIIGPCTQRKGRELLCIWQDKFGIGSVSFLFDKKYKNFKGVYLPFATNGIVGFPRMEQKEWNHVTTWNGTKFNIIGGM